MTIRALKVVMTILVVSVVVLVALVAVGTYASSLDDPHTHDWDNHSGLYVIRIESAAKNTNVELEVCRKCGILRTPNGRWLY